MEGCAAGDDEIDITVIENAFRIYNQEKLLLGSYLRSSFSKPLPLYPEPDINKSHWDHVREEMRWLAGDYIRERKWRQKTARKFIFDSNKSRLENVHNTEQHGKTSKKDVAGGISGEVLSYWKKIHKVVEWRRKNLTEIMQRRELDKQLEKYSRMLSGKLNEFKDSRGSEHQNNFKQLQVGKDDENFSDSASYHPTDSETSDDEEYMREEMAYDRKNDLDYMAEVRDLQFDAHISIEKLLRLHSEIQETGLKWLASCYENSMNGILADEMGLGKTIQTISLLAYLACNRGSWGPHLIIVPTSVILNWEVEFKKWCPAFKILTYFGSQKERKMKRCGWSKPNSFHICITTYRLVVQDQIIFRRKKWGYMILDEAHLIKNWRSQRWQTLLHFNSNRRLLLTGTPLQNNLMELWSLMHFLMPTLFQSHSEFKSWFSNPLMEMVDDGDLVDQNVIARLHDVLRPFILRRLKKDVERNLPEKKEHDLKNVTQSECISKSEKEKPMKGVSSMTKCVLENIVNNACLEDRKGLEKLAHLLRALRIGGHKVLIFTQMTKMLDILESFLNLYGYSYCRLDGSTKPEQRQLLVQRFNTDARLFVFILSTRSGGFGINLTGADTVIFYDTDWNPAIDSQAQDRCHRIGQKREVNIYRLICEGTVEENIMKKAMRKRELDRVAIQSAMFDNFNGKKESVVARENTGLSEVRLGVKANEDFRVDCKVPFMGEQLKLIDIYALSFLEYNNDGFPGKYISEDNTKDDTQLAQLKSAEEDKMDGTDIHDEVQLCVRDWVEEEALTIYKQH
ncbi:unnamed protein product [Bathycoccus prasinos]